MSELKPIPKGEVITDNITKHIDKRFLSSVDLIGAGAVTLTIDRVEKHAELKYGTGESDKNAILIYFKETPKPLKLCKTNIKNIIYALKTTKTADWTGQKITLEVKTVQSFGKQTPAVRVKI
jgi:hypothetical protein